MKFSLLLTVLAFSFSAQSAVKAVSSPLTRQFEPGTVIIRASERALYLIEDSQTALRYPVAIPRRGKEWSGATRVASKQAYPAWQPPAEVRRDHPELPPVIRGGDPSNPMGVAAISLELSEIAIHGTTASMRKSIGSAASYGCIRMYNEDVADLYQRVTVGTPVIMIP